MSDGVTPGRVFVCGDTGLTALLDDLSATLVARGHRVVRGPVDVPGTVRRYDAGECALWFGDVDVAVFTVRHACSREVMAAAPRLRGVVYPTIGIETIDLSAADDLGIAVGHGAVAGNIVGMAEATVMLMLMLFYGVETNIALMRAGKWRRPGHHSLALHGKTIGIVGFGRIARMVAERLAPFGVKIVTYSPRARQADLPSYVEKVDLEQLLSDSDLVSILTGLSPETRHLISAAHLARMKPTAFLVNTGRGAVVDEAALVAALDAGQIAGAALDTFEIEPLPADSPLRARDNVILTPHCVGHTKEGWAEFLPAMIDNIERMLVGTPPLYFANPAVAPKWQSRMRDLAAGG